jgi:hypothetical protein
MCRCVSSLKRDMGLVHVLFRERCFSSPKTTLLLLMCLSEIKITLRKRHSSRECWDTFKPLCSCASSLRIGRRTCPCGVLRLSSYSEQNTWFSRVLGYSLHRSASEQHLTLRLPPPFIHFSTRTPVPFQNRETMG